MRIIRSVDDIVNMEQTAIALGNFDGVHLGHQELIREAVGQADRDGIKSAVFTFSNHPSGLIPGVKAVKSILTDDRKASLIEDLGVDYLFDVPFTEELRDMEAEDFVRELLIGRMNVKDAFCGYNYQFGARASGNAGILASFGEKYGFEVFEMPPFEIDEQVVSSSLIRSLIEKGDVSSIKTYMGRHYEIEGEVVVGNRLGKKLGFPTSNLDLDDSMAAPPNGVYTTYCIYNGVRYPSITNVGVKPTVGDFDKNVETHIFNFNKELYGKYIMVEFLEKMRDEQKFDSLEELSSQIVEDCNKARDWFGQETEIGVK